MKLTQEQSAKRGSRKTSPAAKRAIIYTRQSVEREESISLEVQEQSCRDHADRHGYETVEVIADAGISGLKWDKRPGIQRAMKRIEDHQADVIIVWRWSRLSRRHLDQAVALDRVERAGGAIECAVEPIDVTTAGGRFSRRVLLDMATFESEQKAEQWREAHQRRLNRGLPASAGQRLGYKRVHVDQNTETYEPDPETAPIVVELYERRANGAGFQALADWLIEQGVTSPRRADGQRWTKRGVAYFMRTGFPAGYLYVDRYHGKREAKGRQMQHLKGAHEPIISEDLWQRYQAEDERRTTTAPRLLHPTTRLAGILRCGTCGRSMTIKYGDQIRYRCSNPECPRKAAIRLDRAEHDVRRWLEGIEDELAAEVERRRKAARPIPASTAAARKRLVREEGRTEQALVKLAVDLARDLIPETAYRAARSELEAEREAIRERLARMPSPDTAAGGPVLAELVTVAAGALDVWDRGSTEDVNAMCRALVRATAFRGPRLEVRGAWEEG